MLKHELQERVGSCVVCCRAKNVSVNLYIGDHYITFLDHKLKTSLLAYNAFNTESLYDAVTVIPPE